MGELRLIAEVVVPGHPVSWSPPRTFLGGRAGGKRWHVHEKNKKLCEWQDAIRMIVAASVPPGQGVWTGPVMLCLTFTKGTEDETLWGKRWWASKASKGNGDATNLQKAAEDALRPWKQTAGKGRDKKVVESWPGVIGDDSQVCDIFTRKRYDRQDGVAIKVYAMEED